MRPAPRSVTSRSSRGAVLAAVAVLAAACSSGGSATTSSSGRTTGSTVTTTGPAPSPKRPAALQLRPLAASRSGRARIVDDRGRDVLLRGANLNALGDYYQGDPKLPPTKAPTDGDWDAMAAHGFSVVRLLVSWSELEPTRGAFDRAYVRRIEGAIDAAAARGIYTVVDFHQDAWGKFIASPNGETCAAGGVPAIGWDGAPKWATITDGTSTCRPEGYREGAAAVSTSFRNFYRNRDGIRDAYVMTVSRLAGVLAGNPAVAGIDLFNEPNQVFGAEESIQRYTELATALVTGIRSAEGGAKAAFPHLIFLEPLVLFPLPGTMPAEGFTKDRDIVFAPHNYAEVIIKVLTVEQTFDVSAQTASARSWPLWIGEYGVFDTDRADLAILRRFGEAEDAHLAGSAEWQWRQRCGDPHTVGRPGGHFTGRQYHLTVTTCPADTSKPNDAFLRVVGRPYPRAAPGELTKVSSDAATGALTVEGKAPDRQRMRPVDLVVWVPGQAKPTATVTGLSKPTTTKVTGGWYLVAHPTGGGPYRLTVA